jgi:hypothetical protein
MGKRHHYVPQFYLRYFAIDRNNPRQIKLFNIQSDLYIPRGSLSKQCYRNRFYKTDEFENLISLFEKRFSDVIGKIEESENTPQESSGEYLDLLYFVAMQWLRTPRAVNDFSDEIDKFAKTALSELAERNNMESSMRQAIERVQVSFEDPVLLSIKHFGRMAMCLSDLKMHLLVASSGLEFITSDHPVQTYNIYCEGVDWIGVTGSLSTGLLVFIPLSPHRCLLLYDREIYKVDKPGIDQTIIENETDMSSINALQFVGAESNLYCSSDLGSNYFKALKRRYQRARNTPRSIVKNFRNPNDSTRSFLLSYHPMPKLGFSLSFLSVLRKARKVEVFERAQKHRIPFLPPDPFDPDETLEDAIREAIQVKQDLASERNRLVPLVEKSVR